MSTRPTPDPIDLELIDRYLAGDCTPDEIVVVERWIAARPENTELLATLRSEFGILNDSAPPSDPHAVWRRIADGIDRIEDAARVKHQGAEVGAGVPSRASRGPIPLRVVPGCARERAPSAATSMRRVAILASRVAAALALAVGATLVVRGATHDQAPARVASVAPPRVYAAVPGQRAEFRLSEGTRVVLAPGSRLTVPVDYDSLARVVTLEGQAYFDVAHDVTKPFVVRAGDALVHDLGTRFDIRAFRNEAAVRVVVTQGKVQLGRAPAAGRAMAAESGPRLVAGDVGRLRSTGAVSITRGVDTARFVAWTKGHLVFNRTPIREALAELSRWYDVDVRLADTSLDDRTLTATLRDQPLAEVLSLVALSLGADLERMGRTATLRAKE